MKSKNGVLKSAFPEEDVGKLEGTEPLREDNEQVDVSWGDQFRYVNLGPTKISAMLQTETDEEERKALEIARRFWIMKAPSGPVEAGEPYRGEAAEARHIGNLSEAVNPESRVEHIAPRELGTGGLGLIDFDMLMDQEE